MPSSRKHFSWKKNPTEVRVFLCMSVHFPLKRAKKLLLSFLWTTHTHTKKQRNNFKQFCGRKKIQARGSVKTKRGRKLQKWRKISLSPFSISFSHAASVKNKLRFLLFSTLFFSLPCQKWGGKKKRKLAAWMRNEERPKRPMMKCTTKWLSGEKRI